ncbi:MAG: hypothetical protein U5K27_02455 [Desulfotignum sp.]|nr:hypothetical protein [Desulfotignum sp.]
MIPTTWWKSSGLNRAKDHIKDADLVLFLVEPGTVLSEMEFTKIFPREKKTILVINKMDLVYDKNGGDKPGRPVMPKLPAACADLPKMEVSALHDRGIKELREKIIYLCVRDLTMDGSAVVPNLRHKNALTRTLSFLTSAKEGIIAGQPEETLAIDLKNSIDSLGTITGEAASLDILDTIFNHFCIGK